MERNKKEKNEIKLESYTVQHNCHGPLGSLTSLPMFPFPACVGFFWVVGILCRVVPVAEVGGPWGLLPQVQGSSVIDLTHLLSCWNIF